MLDDQGKSDSYKRKRAKKAKKRLVKVFVGGGDLTEKGFTLLMPGELRFKTLYEKHGGWQKYSPSDFDLWYGALHLQMDQSPDDVGLPHEARVVARGKILQYSWMNMDSRIVVITLNEIVNRLEGIRLTLHKNEPMTSVYDRVANITGITLSSLRVGVQGKVSIHRA